MVSSRTAARKRVIVSDSDDDKQLDDAATLTTAPDTDISSNRPARKAKADAKKKWESLVPGQSRKKQRREDAQLSDAEGDADEAHKVSTKNRQSTGKASDGHISGQSRVHGGASHKHSVPPKFRKQEDTGNDSPAAGSDDESSSKDESDSRSSRNEESGEAERTDDEDDGLEVMERNPKALQKMFADETAHWVDEDVDPMPPRRKSDLKSSTKKAVSETPHKSRRSSTHLQAVLHSPSQSAQEDDDGLGRSASRPKSHKHETPKLTAAGKKRAADEHDVSESDSGAPPPKKSAKKATDHDGPRTKTSHSGSRPEAARKNSKSSKPTSTPSAHRAAKDASKRLSSKRQDEIPHFKKPSDVEVQTARHSASTTARAPRKSISRIASDSESGSSSDASPSDSGSEDSGIEIVFPRKGKLKLQDQHRRVYRVVKRSIAGLLHDVALRNAFPDGPQKHGQTVYRSLVNSAAELGYGDILKRLKKQDEYAAELCKIPSQRIPTFRGQVRKLVEGQPCTAFGLKFGDKAKGDWLQEGFRYIYPFDYETQTIKTNKPYSPPVFLETLRVAFFKRPSSLGFRLSKFFESSVPDKPDEKEIPAPMLALVATALHAAIEDCKHNLTQSRDFTANDYWNVYKDHIQELSTIRHSGPLQFHVLMHGFWRQLSASMGGSGHAGGPRKSFLDVAAMDVE
ncbi:hypothetical protein VTO73DRAFT_9053 [Trametes versicolor]